MRKPIGFKYTYQLLENSNKYLVSVDCRGYFGISEEVNNVNKIYIIRKDISIWFNKVQIIWRKTCVVGFCLREFECVYGWEIVQIRSDDNRILEKMFICLIYLDTNLIQRSPNFSNLLCFESSNFSNPKSEKGPYGLKRELPPVWWDIPLHHYFLSIFLKFWSKTRCRDIFEKSSGYCINIELHL